MLLFDDALGERTREAKRELQQWARRFCMPARGEEGPWTEQDTFLGYSNVALGFAALDREENFDECKMQLLRTVTADGMVRLTESALATEPRELAWCQRVYKQNRLRGLGQCLADAVRHHDGSEAGRRLAVMTFSGIHVPLRSAFESLEGRVRCREFRVGQIDSERRLLTIISDFLKSDDNVLVLQMRQFRDCNLAQLTRARVEELFASHSERERAKTGVHPNKHACVLIHVDREVREGDDAGSGGCASQLLSGWDRLTIDSIVPEDQHALHRREFEDVVRDPLLFAEMGMCREELFWCFTRMQ